MNSEKNKRENRKALKVFIPIIIVAAVIGGIIGGFSSTDTAESVADIIGDFFGKLIFAISPYMVIAAVITGVVLSIRYYRISKKSFEKCKLEEDEEKQEKLYQFADKTLAKGMMVIGITEIVAFIFFSGLLAYIERYIEEKHIIYMATLAVFILGSFSRIKIQQLMIDFQKIMNPEKTGSAYDFNFQKKWENSCDELEKFMIYKSAYKAYRVGSLTCAIVFIVLMLFSFFFDYGPMPAMAVGLIWLVSVASYYREAMRLEKDKINL